MSSYLALFAVHVLITAVANSSFYTKKSSQFVQLSSALVKQFCKKIKVKVKMFPFFPPFYFSEGPIFH